MNASIGPHLGIQISWMNQIELNDQPLTFSSVPEKSKCRRIINNLQLFITSNKFHFDVLSIQQENSAMNLFIHTWKI